MGLDNLVNDENSNGTESDKTNKIENAATDKAANRSKSSKKFVEISREEFENFLDNDAPYYWKIVNTDAGEIVYETEEFMFEYPDVTLRIFSTIEKGVGISRGKGDDAIRTVIWTKDKEHPIGGRTKTLRIQTWKKNLLKKIKSLSNEWQNYVDPCPQCNGWLVKREGKNGEFLGCINWKKDGSGCNYMESIGEPEEHEGECPRCEGGYLVKRSGPYGEFLGCTNWRSDGSGCDYKEQIN